MRYRLCTVAIICILCHRVAWVNHCKLRLCLIFWLSGNSVYSSTRSTAMLYLSLRLPSPFYSSTLPSFPTGVASLLPIHRQTNSVQQSISIIYSYRASKNAENLCTIWWRVMCDDCTAIWDLVGGSGTAIPTQVVWQVVARTLSGPSQDPPPYAVECLA